MVADFHTMRLGSVGESGFRAELPSRGRGLGHREGGRISPAMQRLESYCALLLSAERRQDPHSPCSGQSSPAPRGHVGRWAAGAVRPLISEKPGGSVRCAAIYL